MPRTPQPRQRTSDIKAGSGQDATVPAVAHQVVPRLLLGAVEAGEGHAERGGAEGGVGGGGQAPAVQGPVQVLGAQVEVGADRAGGRQRGADQQGGVLGGNHCRVCSQKIKKNELAGGKKKYTSIAQPLAAREVLGLGARPASSGSTSPVWGAAFIAPYSFFWGNDVFFQGWLMAF